MKYELTARRIRQAMSEMNMSQQELADKSKIGKSSISHYVNGSNEPGNKSAYQMAKVLNVNPAWLMGLDVPMREVEESPKDGYISPEEMQLVLNYRNADETTREMIRRLTLYRDMIGEKRYDDR